MFPDADLAKSRPTRWVTAIVALAATVCFVPVTFAADQPAVTASQPTTTSQPDTSKTQPATAASQPITSGEEPAIAQTQPYLFQDESREFEEQGRTYMNQLNQAEPGPRQIGIPPLQELEKTKQAFPFIDDSTFGGEVRSFYFYRDKYDKSLSEAWALGGSLSYKSGYLADIFAVGAVAYTSQPLYAPDDRDGTLLLKPGQEGYTVLGQAYGEFKVMDRVFVAIGRKSYETPFMNSNDIRMTPNTFEGASLYGKVGGKDGAPEWRFGTGYIDKIKPKNSDDFIWMSKAAGSNVDRGVVLAGANVDWKRLSFGAIDYYSADVINIFYTETKYALLKGDGYKLNLAAQYADQRSNGEDLASGGAFSSGQWGVKTDLALGDAVLTAGFTDVISSNTNMQAPWSGYPGYTSVQVQDFDRANESALLLKAAYDFSNLGAQGLSAYALWVHGNGREFPNYNEDEYDLNLQWAFKKGWLKGTSLRMRYAYVGQRGGGDPNISDFRFIVNYDF